jgi:hypothetical protein
MPNVPTSPGLRLAAQERAYRAEKKFANRELLKNFVFIAFLLVLTITVLGKIFTKGPESDGESIIARDLLSSVDGAWSLLQNVHHHERTKTSKPASESSRSIRWPDSCTYILVSPRQSVSGSGEHTNTPERPDRKEA